MAKRILLLDDNQDILDVVQEALIYENFEVKTTEFGGAVIPLVEEFKPDLVILDYRVAGFNGGELCQQIKAHPNYRDTPVIIFSAYINHKEDIFAYGCNAVISKPFDLNELVEKVNGLLTPVN